MGTISHMGYFDFYSIILKKVRKSSTLPECLEPRGCHWGCTCPLVPSLPTPGGGGIEPKLGKPGKKNIKSTTFGNSKSEAHEWNIPRIFHLTLEYSWNIDGKRWNIDGIFLAYSSNIHGTFHAYSTKNPNSCEFPSKWNIPHLTPMVNWRAKWNI